MSEFSPNLGRHLLSAISRPIVPRSYFKLLSHAVLAAHVVFPRTYIRDCTNALKIHSPRRD